MDGKFPDAIKGILKTLSIDEEDNDDDIGIDNDNDIDIDFEKHGASTSK